jgi:hypothetical protein
MPTGGTTDVGRESIYVMHFASSYVPYIYYGKEEPLQLGLASREQPFLLLSRQNLG